MTPDQIPEQPIPPDLSPLGVGEILDAAFRLLRQNLRTYLLVTVWMISIPAILTAMFMLSEIVAIRGGLLLVNNPSSYTTTAGWLGLLSSLMQLFCFGVLVHLSTRLYMNHAETSRSIIKRSARRFLPFFGQTILLGLFALLVIGVSGALSIPFGAFGIIIVLTVGLAWVTWVSLSAPAFWYEEIGPARAIGRSSELAGKRFWPVLGTLLVGLVLVGVFAIGLGALLLATFVNTTRPTTYVLSTNGLDYLGSIISLLITAPIISVLYFDVRVRKEGFDMQLKLQQTRQQEPPPPVPW